MNAIDINSSDGLRELYRELILDHARSPHHFGKLSNVTHQAEGINPLCGDKLKVYMRIDASNTIADIAFEGSGCAISVASASLMTDTLAGLDVALAKEYFKAVTARLTNAIEMEAPALNLDKIRALDGVREFPARIKCATLAWHAMRSAISNQSTPASTE